MQRRSFLANVSGIAASLALPYSNRALAAPSRAEWTPLFDGASLDGWNFYQDGIGTDDINSVVSVHGNELRFLSDSWQGGAVAPFGHLATKRAYSDFHVCLEYRWGDRRYRPRALAKRNSGLVYHLQPMADAPTPDAVEFQIQESDVGDAILVNTQAIPGPSLGGSPAWPDLPPGATREYQRASVAGGIARQWYRRDGNFELTDAWNRVDLIAFEDRAAHLVNGRIVNTIHGIRRQDPDVAGEFVSLTGGHIAFQFEAAEISFRNIMIRPIGPNDLTGPFVV